MNTWEERKFLEELLLPDPSIAEHGNSACPDIAVLIALVEEGRESDLAQAFWRHIIRCPSCSDLFNRLRDFQNAALAAPPQEADLPAWKPKTSSWWKSFSFDVFPARTRYAFAACILLVLVGVSIAFYISSGGLDNSSGPTQLAENRPTRGAFEPSPRVETPPLEKGENTTADQPLLSQAPVIFNQDALFLPAGSVLRMTVEVVREPSGTNYQVEGKLSGSADALLGTGKISFSANLVPGSETTELSIGELVRDGVHDPLEDRQTAKVAITWPVGVAAIHSGEEFDVRLESVLALRPSAK